jgi:hypothetical protein
MSYDNRPQIQINRLVATTNNILPISDTATGSTLSGESTATVVTAPSLASCTLDAVWATSIQELYDREKESIGWWQNEDLGRYVWYGWRTITADNGGVWYGILRAFFRKDNTCYSANTLAGYLCRQSFAAPDATVATLLAEGAEYDSTDFIVGLTEQSGNEGVFDQDIIRELKEYYQSRSIVTTNTSIAMPYRWIVPLNMSFNRSLQNHSSYYTDIGMVWLPALLIVLLGIIYALCLRDLRLMALTISTTLWWIRWMLVADAIVRYGMGLIVWTTLAAAAVLIKRHVRNKDSGRARSQWIIFGALGLFFLTQWVLNMTRISSQGVGWVFASYKQWYGMMPAVVTQWGNISVSNTIQGVSKDDVFALQFPHYLPIINYLEDRDPSDGITIAGTYLQYFLDDQSNIESDGLVVWVRQRMSDGDVCASYLRLKDSNQRYVIIDPNIATVVLGEGNATLKERFIMKEDASWERIADGVMSMFAKMGMAGYARVASTNNLAIKYAYNLPSETITSLMESVGETDEVAFRTNLATARFLSDDTKRGQYINIVWSIFSQTFATIDGLEDMSDVFGQSIDTAAVWPLVLQNIQWWWLDMDIFDQLTNDQQILLMRYMNLYQASTNPSQTQQYQQQLGQIVQQSLGSSSQIVLFELLEQ